jgi:zinc transporter ZupT
VSQASGWTKIRSNVSQATKSVRNKAVVLVESEAADDDDDDDDEGSDDESSSKSSSSAHSNSSAILSILGDLLHNFTDGLTLGLTSHTSLSISTFLSILLHELPHELGDFAVLLDHGYTKNQAIRMQFVTATAAFVGAAIGIYLPAVTNVNFLPAIAGSFIYLATVSLLPEAIRGSADKSRLARFGVLLAFVGGVAVMWGLTMVEGGCGHGHSHEHGHGHGHEGDGHEHHQHRHEEYDDHHEHDCEHDHEHHEHEHHEHENHEHEL